MGKGTEIGLTFPGGPCRRESAREGQGWAKGEARLRERGKRMRSSHARESHFCTYTQRHPLPASLNRSDSRVRCLPTRQRADGSAPPAWLRLGLAHTRHAQTAHAASPVAAFAAFFLTCPIRKAINKWLIQIPPSSIASRAVKKMRFGN